MIEIQREAKFYKFQQLPIPIISQGFLPGFNLQLGLDGDMGFKKIGLPRFFYYVMYLKQSSRKFTGTYVRTWQKLFLQGNEAKPEVNLTLP